MGRRRRVFTFQALLKRVLGSRRGGEGAIWAGRKRGRGEFVFGLEGTAEE